MKNLIFKRIRQSNLCIIIFVISQGIYSCTDSALELALEKAGKNRCEMEKVLLHFQKSPKDSLKYLAARFLIENMPGQITYTNDSLNLLRTQECMFPYSNSRWSIFLQAELLQIRYASLYGKDRLKTLEDIESLNSKFLIEHIETVFRKLDSCAWARDINFEDFCEYLLPYRIGQEKVFLWRDSTLDGFSQLQHYVNNYADTRTSAISLSKKLPHIIHIPWREALSLLPPSMNNYHLDCEDMAIRHLLLYRLCNIPAAIDIIPCWGNYNGQHAWAQPIEKRRRYMNELDKFGWTTIPKVYRRTYSQQSIIQETDEYIPAFFLDTHLKDVTDNYLHTVEVKEFDFPKDIHYGYLCVFNRGNWVPVAQSLNNAGKCVFPNMGPGIVYLPAYYNNKDKLIAISNPFRLTSNGEKIYFSANGKKGNLFLDRKYPANSSIFFSSTTNIVIKASQYSNFYPCDTFVINKNSLMQPIDIKVKPAYRYFQISPVKYDIVAEIYFFNRNNKRILAHVVKPNNYSSILQDNNILTYEYIQPTTFSLSPTDSITQIRVLPYNDGNGIYPGDEYELLYFDKEKQWISCGYKRANNYTINYQNIPQGALYWLQNLTTGKEERIFTYENGKQRFW